MSENYDLPADDGGPSEEDITNPGEPEVDDELDEFIKKILNSGLSSVELDKDLPSLAGDEDVAKAETMYCKGFISKEELAKKVEVIAKAKALRNAGYIDDEEMAHAVRHSTFLVPQEIPDPSDFPRLS